MALFDLLVGHQGLALDRYLVRYTGHSLINRVFAQQSGISPQPPLLLRSRGRKTGLWRDAVLPWFRHGSGRVVVGSAGGAPKDPQWVGNLREEPQAEIFVDRGLQFVQARFLEGEEYSQVWQRITAEVPEYEVYQRRCSGERRIPLVYLETV